MKFAVGFLLGFIISFVFCAEIVENGMEKSHENKTTFLGYFLEKAIKNDLVLECK